MNTIKTRLEAVIHDIETDRVYAPYSAEPWKSRVLEHLRSVLPYADDEYALLAAVRKMCKANTPGADMAANIVWACAENSR